MLRVVHDADAHEDVARDQGHDRSAAVDLDELCRLAAREMIAVALEAERRAYLEFEDDLREVLASNEHLMALIDARIRRGDEEIGYSVVEVARLHEGRITERWAFMDFVPADVAAFFAD